MATTSKPTKSAKTTAPAKAKVAPHSAAKAPAKAVAVPSKTKPAKAPVKKVTPAKAATTKPAVKPVARPVAKPAVKPAARTLPKPATTALLTVKSQISVEQRRHYIEIAAYFIAERNGFAAENALDHWTQAEAEIDRLLREGKLNI